MGSTPRKIRHWSLSWLQVLPLGYELDCSQLGDQYSIHLLITHPHLGPQMTTSGVLLKSFPPLSHWLCEHTEQDFLLLLVNFTCWLYRLSPTCGLLSDAVSQKVRLLGSLYTGSLKSRRNCSTKSEPGKNS